MTIQTGTLENAKPNPQTDHSGGFLSCILQVILFCVFAASLVSLFAGFSCYAFPLGEWAFRCGYWLLSQNFDGVFVSASGTLLSASAVAIRAVREYF